MVETDRLLTLQQEIYQLDQVYTEIGYQIWVSENVDELAVLGEEAGRIKKQLSNIRQQILYIDTINS